jgi:hypothetical protein
MHIEVPVTGVASVSEVNLGSGLCVYMFVGVA